MSERDEGREVEGVSAPPSAFIRLHFWDNDNSEEPILDFKGFDIPIPDVGETLSLDSIEASLDSPDRIDGKGDAREGLNESNTEYMPHGQFEVTSREYTYTKVKDTSNGIPIDPPLINVDVYMDQITDETDD